MISAIDNSKNQYYEKVGAVNFQTSRGYPPEFYQQLAQKTGMNNNRAEETKINRNFGNFLAYGNKNNLRELNPFAQERNDLFSPSHPDVRSETTARVMDFMA